MVREILERKTDIATLCQELGVQRLYAFGSATTVATLTEVGDLDFLVQFEPLPPVQCAHNYFHLAEQLETLFQKPIDLAEMETPDNPYFKEAVDESKMPVYEPARSQQAPLRRSVAPRSYRRAFGFLPPT